MTAISKYWHSRRVSLYMLVTKYLLNASKTCFMTNGWVLLHVVKVEFMRLPYEKHKIYNKSEIFLTFTTWKLDSGS